MSAHISNVRTVSDCALRHSSKIAVGGAFLAIIACGEVTAGDLFKCALRDGRTVYQDSQCLDNAKQSVLSPAAPAGSSTGDASLCPTTLIERPQSDPATGMESAEAQKARMELERVVDFLTNYEGCNEDTAGFSTKYGASYRQWHQKDQAAIARYEQNPRARRMVECRLQAERVRARSDTSQGRTYKAEMCNTVIGPTFEKLSREGPPR